MNNFIKVSSLLLIIFLSGCAASVLKDSKDEFFTNNEDGLAVFQMSLSYNGNQKNIEFQDWKSKCHLFFSNSSGESLKSKIKSNYIFVKTDSADVYLDRISCLEYRVFYNQIRLRKINEKVLQSFTKGKLNYGGEIEINWIPEIFKASDMFNLGDLGIQDGGVFAIKINQDYKGYLDFMLSNYKIDPNKSIDASE